MLTKKFFYAIGIAMLAGILFFACNNDNSKQVEDPTFQIVTGFAISKKGEKLLATDNGLFLFDETSEKFNFVSTEPLIAPLNDLIISKTQIEELWLASNEGAYNYATLELVTTENSGLLSNDVRYLNFDFNNRTYFATPQGVSILYNSEWSENHGKDSLFLKYEITDLASAINGFTYTATNGGGVERFNLDVDGVSSATIFDTDWTKLESNNINTVYIDSITQVYGTDMGVAMHFSEYTKWDWETYSIDDGLIDNNVISVVKDKSNNWWFGTIVGLSKFDNSNWTSYTVETDGILSNNIKYLAVDIDGSVWFASDRGLSQFTNNQWTNYIK